MKFELYKDVVLKKDILKYKLKKGDILTLVEYFPKTEKHPEHYAAEMFSVKGHSLGVCIVESSWIEKLDENYIYITSARKLKKAI